ncbi:hypothetical protein JOF56_006907 [Kibdelosporangium banguiense]|uniref:Integrase n=1 Tax=Kibdelosporangium banguiense TaxID=1365924 RepID=A0ABS4TQ38_9PSEU|nr:SAVMC3_10250 family protein [Kibdelosporangium banguiense]MBP2326522.1 hypothetical protein [Kibdelosporangium banguiense]
MPNKAHAARLGLKLATSTTGTLLTGSGTPRWETVETFVLACQRHMATRRMSVAAEEFDLTMWRERYDRIRLPAKSGTAVSPAHRTPMRDLLYLSVSKMRILIPQLPDTDRPRHSMNAGTNAESAALRAEPRPEMLDAVIRMIDAERSPRRHDDPQLRAGDWIRFTEEFHYGELLSPLRSNYSPPSDLVYFWTGQPKTRIVLCGSLVHLLDKRQTEQGGLHVRCRVHR